MEGSTQGGGSPQQGVPDGPYALQYGDPPNSEERTWGMLAHFANLLFPALAPLVVYLIYKDKSKFVAYHALQSAVAHGLIVYVISGFIVAITCGLGFPILFVSPILAIVWGLKANQGEWKGYPLLESVGK